MEHGFGLGSRTSGIYQYAIWVRSHDREAVGLKPCFHVALLSLGGVILVVCLLLSETSSILSGRGYLSDLEKLVDSRRVAEAEHDG